MKSFTDIEQSKKLVEILPLESADMFFVYDYLIGDFGGVDFIRPGVLEIDDIPCWSLAALIEVLPLGVDIHNITDGHKMYYYVEIYTKEIYMKLRRMNKGEICLSTERYENLVDACVEIILKLHEEKLL